ncbi:MAG: YihY/virulence factor BrkB family protein [Polyangia bacterium]|jgi:membrane protein
MIWPGKQIGWKEFFKRLGKSWSEDSIGTTAAALAYYGILALFPFLLFLVALTGLVLDPQRIQALVTQLGSVAPGQVTQIVGARLHSLAQSSSGGLLTIGIIGAIWSVSGAVSSLMQALNRSYDVRETRPFWKSRLIALAVTLATGVIAVITLLVMFGVPVVGSLAGGLFGAIITWLRFPVAGLIVMGLWAMLYWALPNVKPRFQLITFGSVVGVVLWLLASWGFSEYVRHSKSYETTYGTLGGVIVLLVWMWLSSAVVLAGAEMNKLLTPAEKLKKSETGEKAGGTEKKEQAAVSKPRPPKPEPEPA